MTILQSLVSQVPLLSSDSQRYSRSRRLNNKNARRKDREKRSLDERNEARTRMGTRIKDFPSWKRFVSVSNGSLRKSTLTDLKCERWRHVIPVTRASETWVLRQRAPRFYTFSNGIVLTRAFPYVTVLSVGGATPSLARKMNK